MHAEELLCDLENVLAVVAAELPERASRRKKAELFLREFSKIAGDWWLGPDSPNERPAVLEISCDRLFAGRDVRGDPSYYVERDEDPFESPDVSDDNWDHRTGQEMPTRYTQISGLLNAGLAVGKLSAGWIGGSFALVADGLNSLLDVGVSIAVWLGVRLSRRPADDNHAYGHGKIEQEISRLVSMAVLVTGSGILVSAAQRIGDAHGSPRPIVVWVAMLAIPIKGWMSAYASRQARLHRSDAIRADALNHLADAGASACVLIGTGVCFVAGPAFAWADDVAAGCVGLLMIIAAAREIHSTSRDLIDQMPPPDIMNRVLSIANDVPGVSRVETAVGRKSGPSYFLDLHVEVRGDLSVHEAHSLAHQVKDSVLASVKEVADIVIHIEPDEGEHKEGSGDSG